MARKATASRMLRVQAEKDEALAEKTRILRELVMAEPKGLDATLEQKQKRVERQIALIDRRFEDCSIDDMPKLAQAKARLWELLYPKPGSLKPRHSKRGDTGDAQPLS